MAADVLARVRAEIEERLRELRHAVAEHEQLLGVASALDAEAKARVAVKPRAAAKPRRAPKPKRGKAAFGPTEQAIVAALEHGSHTVGELGMVTAMSGGEIREGARQLLAAGRIVRAKREGKPAYALSDKA
jgi:hypothetical protein